MNDGEPSRTPSPSLRDKIVALGDRYRTPRSAIMPALYCAQEDFGYLSDDVMKEVADILDVPEIWVFELATFYTLFHTQPVGRYHIQFCDNVSCMLLEAESFIAHMEQRLGIRKGEITSDGLFSLTSVECLGSCGTAPVMQVNDVYYEQLSKRRIDEILDELRAEAAK